jgi:hypothetical protein
VSLSEELDHAGRVGQIVLALEQRERLLSTGEDVQAAVGQSLQYLLDLARAARRLEFLIGQPEDAERALERPRLGLEAALDHAAIAILEDVQRHALAGQRHDPQREQRKATEGALGHRNPSVRGYWTLKSSPSPRPRHLSILARRAQRECADARTRFGHLRLE